MKKSLFDFIKHGFILHPDVYVSEYENYAEVVEFTAGRTVTLSGIWSNLPHLISQYGNLDKIISHLTLLFPNILPDTIRNDCINVLLELYEGHMLARAPVNPDISFVIPAYNSESTIDAVLASIFQQKTKYTFEVILVNNNSTDRTTFLASEYPIIIVDEARRSRSYARNRGLRISRGTFVAFLDSDVRIGEFWIDRMLDGFEIDQIVAVQSMIEYSAVKSHGILRSFHDYMNQSIKRRYVNALRLPIPFFDTASVMLRRDFLIKNNILFDTNLGRSEDVDLSFQCLKHGGSLAYIAEVVIKDLGHNSVHRFMGSMFRQAYWDRQMIKKWLPSVKGFAPTIWGLTVPEPPRSLTRVGLFSFFISLIRWFGWCLSTFLNEKLDKESLETESNSSRTGILNQKSRLAITPDFIRIVFWNQLALIDDRGPLLNKSARSMLVDYLSLGDPVRSLQVSAQRYGIDPKNIENDFFQLKKKLTDLGVLS